MSFISLNENLLKSCILLAIFHGHFLKNSHTERLQTFNPKCYISTLKDRQRKKVLLLLKLRYSEEMSAFICQVSGHSLGVLHRDSISKGEKIQWRSNSASEQNLFGPRSMKIQHHWGQPSNHVLTEINSPSKERQYSLGFIDHNYTSTVRSGTRQARHSQLTAQPSTVKPNFSLSNFCARKG